MEVSLILTVYGLGPFGELSIELPMDQQQEVYEQVVAILAGLTEP